MKRLFSVIPSTLLLVAALTACSSNEDKELLPADLVDIDSAKKVKVLWSTDIGAGAGETYTRLPMAYLDNALIAVDSDGLVEARHVQTGKYLWDQELEQPVASGVGASGEQVFVGTLKGQVIAMSASTGEVQWRSSVSSEVLAQPQSNGSEVVIQTVDGRVVALSADDGRQLWMYDTNVPALTLRGTSSPIVSFTTVYAGFSSGKIIALNVKDGSLLWQQRVAVPQGRSELERVIDINAAPLLIGDVLYSGSYQGRLVALNRGTGRGIWSQNESTFNDLSSADGMIFIATAQDAVKAYDAVTGQLQWENDQLVRRQIGAPQVFGAYVAVSDSEGYVHIMNQADGKFVARRKVDGDGIRSPLLGRDETLYVYGNSGELEALSIR